MKHCTFLLAGLISLPLVFTACSNDDEPDNTKVYPRHAIALSAEQTAQKEQANRFAYNLWNDLSEYSTSDNMVFSPLSLYQALSMTANGTDGETLKAFKKFLAGDENASIEEINEFNRYLMSELPKVDPSVKLSLANMYCSKDITPLYGFVSTMTDYYNAPFYTYTSPAEGFKFVNNWAKERSEGEITNFLNSEDELGALDIFNATYFNGRWTAEIDKNRTKKITFHNASGTDVDVDMMCNDEATGYQTDKAICIDMDYGNAGYKMTIVMPFDFSDINECIRETEKGEFKIVSVWLPKFDIDYNTSNLVDLFSSKGLTPLNNLSRMLTDPNVRINKIIQKSNMTVNEEGTKVAAVTQVDIGYTANMPSIVIIDRPFGFKITETSTGTVLFMGRVTKL